MSKMNGAHTGNDNNGNSGNNILMMNSLDFLRQAISSTGQSMEVGLGGHAALANQTITGSTPFHSTVASSILNLAAGRNS